MVKIDIELLICPQRSLMNRRDLRTEGWATTALKGGAVERYRGLLGDDKTEETKLLAGLATIERLDRELAKCQAKARAVRDLAALEPPPAIAAGACTLRMAETAVVDASDAPTDIESADLFALLPAELADEVLAHLFRALRFVFSTERNRQTFRRLFPPDAARGGLDIDTLPQGPQCYHSQGGAAANPFTFEGVLKGVEHTGCVGGARTEGLRERRRQGQEAGQAEGQDFGPGEGAPKALLQLRQARAGEQGRARRVPDLQLEAEGQRGHQVRHVRGRGERGGVRHLPPGPYQDQAPDTGGDAQWPGRGHVQRDDPDCDRHRQGGGQSNVKFIFK